MDFVRNVGNSTMRMMDDEAGAQVLFVALNTNIKVCPEKFFPEM